ncbi:MAG: VOC family protein [Gemmatimonadales bacterium]
MRSHPGPTLRGTTEISSREGHVAIAVRSFDEARAHLEAAGVPFDARPRGRTPWAQISCPTPTAT